MSINVKWDFDDQPFSVPEPFLLAADFLSKSATRVKSSEGFSNYHYDVV